MFIYGRMYVEDVESKRMLNSMTFTDENKLTTYTGWAKKAPIKLRLSYCLEKLLKS